MGKILCVIGARGGSKGVPGKNVMLMHGKPLIGWTIERALALSEISEVVVSTDDPEIAKVAQECGAKVPFMRPPELATSAAGKFQVWQHALNESEKIFDTTYDIFLDMDCTNPLIEADDLRAFISRFKELRQQENIDGLITVSKPHRNPYFNQVEVSEARSLKLSKSLPDRSVVSRQGAPQVWDIVASLYIFTPEYIRRANGLLEGDIRGFEVPVQKAFDIDEPFDAELVEWLLGKQIEAGRK